MTINHIRTTPADARRIIHMIVCTAAGEKGGAK